MEFSDILVKNKAPVSNYLPIKHYTPSFHNCYLIHPVLTYRKIAVNK